MGKGSALMDVILKKERERERLILRLANLALAGYDYCSIDHKWYYRKHGSNRKWTPLDPE